MKKLSIIKEMKTNMIYQILLSDFITRFYKKGDLQ